MSSDPGRPRTILLVAPLFAPENAAGTYRSLYLARNLEAHGFDVRVLTRRIDEIDRRNPALLDVFPDGERVLRVASDRSLNDVYLALRRLVPSRAATEPEVEDAATSATAATTPSPPDGHTEREVDSGFRRLLSEGLVFPDEFVGWARAARREGAAWLQGHPPDLVFVTGPPFSGFEVATSLATRFQAPLVVDFRDPWGPGTGSVQRYYHPHWESRSLALERGAMDQAKLILFNSPGMASYTAERFPKLAPRMRMILNGSEAPRCESDETISPETPLRFSHIGVLYAGRHLRALVHALDQGAKEGRAGAGLVVEQIGDEAPHELLAADLTDAPEVVVRQVGEVSRAEALERAQAPGVLVVVQAAPERDQIPSKVFDYLATGNPVVVVSPEASAVWEMMRPYERCIRIDLEPSSDNVTKVAGLLDRWRSGDLRRVRAVEDTEHLTRRATGREMVEALSAVISDPGDSPRP